MGRKLYVGNLPSEVGEADLQQLFAAAGTVDTVSVMRDMTTGRGRRFAFVEMNTDARRRRPFRSSTITGWAAGTSR